ncbi:unnamed protein product, partial [Urochloa humidicola]
DQFDDLYLFCAFLIPLVRRRRSPTHIQKERSGGGACATSKLSLSPAARASPPRRRSICFRALPTQPKGAMSASDLPDELWARVLELGATSSALGFRDLCCLAIASPRLGRISLHPALWSALLSRDFPSQSQPSSSSSISQQQHPKSLYKTKFERHKVRMAEARRRAVFEAEARVLACRRRLAELEDSMRAEGKRMKAAAQEVDNLERVRRASVALNVWQPQVVHGRQKQLVQQCTVPVDSRLSDLNMELKVCKQQIATYKNSYNKEKHKLDEYEEALKRAKYHPLQDTHTSGIIKEPCAKRKKLK